MHISATIKNSYGENNVTVSTEGRGKTVAIPARPEGYGSSVNGGELLLLALATCYCNDVYREADRRHMEILSVEVTVRATFGKEGEPAREIEYEVALEAPDSTEQEVAAFIRYVDTVAEIQNTLRKGVAVRLKEGRT